MIFCVLTGINSKLVIYRGFQQGHSIRNTNTVNTNAETFVLCLLVEQAQKVTLSPSKCQRLLAGKNNR